MNFIQLSSANISFCAFEGYGGKHNRQSPSPPRKETENKQEWWSLFIYLFILMEG